MRYALYARYSSDNQSESSCEDQFRLCREAVEKMVEQLSENTRTTP